MALQTSGAISLNDIHVEAGGSSGSQATINDTDIRGLISKASGAQMSFSEWYGASASQSFTISSNQTNLNLASWLSSNGWDGTSTAIVTINSGVWIYSTSTSNYGLEITSTLNGKLQLLNYGKIIGKGGVGFANGTDSRYVSGNGENGQAAIRNTATGISITNYSGAYIAGGGGGGGGGAIFAGGGGGGAGGATGGQSAIYGGGAGGGLNASGSEGARRSGPDSGFGGGAGGEGGSNGGGGGGGRILPGVGGSGRNGPNGGSGGNAGGSSGSYAGGGGGRGASGGNGSSNSGGSGGAAISSTQTYTLSNSGTIYGST